MHRYLYKTGNTEFDLWDIGDESEQIYDLKFLTKLSGYIPAHTSEDFLEYQLQNSSNPVKFLYRLISNVLTGDEFSETTIDDGTKYIKQENRQYALEWAENKVNTTNIKFHYAFGYKEYSIIDNGAEDQFVYDVEFLKKLSSYRPPSKCIDFLEYQLGFSDNPYAFLKRLIEYVLTDPLFVKIACGDTYISREHKQRAKVWAVDRLESTPLQSSVINGYSVGDMEYDIEEISGKYTSYDESFLVKLGSHHPPHAAEPFLTYQLSQTANHFNFLRNLTDYVLTSGDFASLSEYAHLTHDHTVFALEWAKSKKACCEPMQSAFEKALANNMHESKARKILEYAHEKGYVFAIELKSKGLFVALANLIAQVEMFQDFLSKFIFLESLKGLIPEYLNSKAEQKAIDQVLTEAIATIKSSDERLHKDKDLPTIQWTGSHTEFIELVYALIESGKISYKTKEEALHTFQQFFRLSVLNRSQALQAIKTGYSSDNPTSFLDKLQTTLKNYLTREEI
ncbi:RteC domain-containing protein [Cytophagaceae bacterium DM2B3-1]|uniref:RteC domain-containing protein n=1 Tax=Xanthocytophaga flava TaxID=3048013 RepID=A0ABT7CR16_9BACT|nr:RteC domain-containing protein [Xanthocytophaga flavus]MDJ1496167.1 RteC domain-containing protein [Xanthocytophaga flavus]